MANTKEKEQMKQEIKKMLSWYTFESEEIDTDVMENLVKLLDSMEKNSMEKNSTQKDSVEKKASEEMEGVGEKEATGERENPQKAYARFLQYKAEREAEEAVLIADFPKKLSEDGDGESACADKPYKKGKASSLGSMKRTGRRKPLTIVGAAACFAVLFLLGVTTGVRANQDGGFFHWLSKDESGVTVITSPQNLDGGTNSIQATAYESVEEVPEEYREYVIGGEELESLREYEFQKVDIMEGGSFFQQFSVFSKADGTEEILLGGLHYQEAMTYSRENYEGYEHLYDIKDNQIKFEVFRENISTELKYIVCFYYENGQYFVQGENNLEMIEKLAKEYAEYIIKVK